MCLQGRGDAERFVFLFCMLLWWLKPTSAIPALNKLSLENNDSLAVLSSLHKEVRMQQAPGKHMVPGAVYSCYDPNRSLLQMEPWPCWT